MVPFIAWTTPVQVSVVAAPTAKGSGRFQLMLEPVTVPVPGLTSVMPGGMAAVTFPALAPLVPVLVTASEKTTVCPQVALLRLAV
jgi:hypothetical protein